MTRAGTETAPDIAVEPAAENKAGGMLLRRERLLERMRAGVDGRLTVVAAPAGFGKSVLVQQWASEHRSSPVAWVGAGDDGAAPTLLIDRLGAAVTAIGPRPRPMVLVVDTSQLAVATGDDVDRAVAEAVRDLPPAVRLVLVRRGPWPVLVDDVLDIGGLVIDADDLAFTRAETAALMRQTSGRRLGDDLLDALTARTAGWPLAAGAAASRLRGGADADAVIAGIRGDERRIAAFLESEVLDRCPPRARQLLVRSSVLHVLTPASCAAVADDTDAGAMLDLLARHGALIRPVAEDAYVHLPACRELLRAELRSAAAESEPMLLARAAQWHSEAGDPSAAADCLVDGSLWDELIDLVDVHGRSLFERGDSAELLRWLDEIPTTFDDRRRRVALRRAFVLTAVGESRRAEETLRVVDHHLSVPERIVADAVRASWTYNDSAATSATTLIDATLRALEGVDPMEVPDVLRLTSPSSLRTMLGGARARASWYQRDLESAVAGSRAILARPDVYPVWAAHVGGTLALMEAWAGSLTEAEHHARRALDCAASNGLMAHPASFDARAALAHVMRERGDLLHADALLTDLRHVVSTFRRPVAMSVCTIERALWHLAAGHPDLGLTEVQDDQGGGEAVPPPPIAARRRAVEARLLLATGQTDRAEHLLATSAHPLAPELGSVAVQAAMARRDRDSARSRLADWSGWTLHPREQLEWDLWSSVLKLDDGPRDVALKQARMVVDAAEASGHLRLFLDLGSPVERLLRAVARSGTSPYLRSIVGVWDAADAEAAAADRLSRRELEIVRYLPTPLSSAEIASALYISLNTLKSHLRSIYRKLGATSRAEAIARAEERGLA